MRTQFLYVGLLSIMAGGLVGTAGCDDITAGQPSDPSGPPTLVHLFIQDARSLGGTFPNRSSVVDLVDTSAPGTGLQTACSTTDPVIPCVEQFTINFNAPDVSCKNGFCNDPLKVPSTGVPIPLPAPTADMVRDPGGGVQVRIIFNKVLDNSIETVTMDMSKPPKFTYKLNDGIAELDDATGKEVPSYKYYDAAGSPNFPSDLEFVGMGPALVIKPKAPLDPNTKYTVKVNGPAIHDRTGNAAADPTGAPMSASYMVPFTTEQLTPVGITVDNGGTDFPDFTMPPVTIAPDEVIQIGFWEFLSADMAKLTVVSAPAGAVPLAFGDRGADPTMCSITMDPGGNVLDLMNVDSLTGKHAANWPAGAYKLKFTVMDINGKSTFTSDELDFTVAGMPGGAMDPNSSANHLAPGDCMMP